MKDKKGSEKCESEGMDRFMRKGGKKMKKRGRRSTR